MKRTLKKLQLNYKTYRWRITSSKEGKRRKKGTLEEKSNLDNQL
jgi:hypothetical protein